MATLCSRSVWNLRRVFGFGAGMRHGSSRRCVVHWLVVLGIASTGVVQLVGGPANADVLAVKSPAASARQPRLNPLSGHGLSDVRQLLPSCEPQAS